FFDKPALTYWLMAASFRILGFTAEAGRLPAALSGLLVVAATVWLGGLLFDRRVALLAGLVLATTLTVVSFARTAMSDMLLTLWTTLAVGLVADLLERGRSAWLLPSLGAVLGLGFLTKGPVVLLMAGVPILLMCWPRRHERLPPGRGALLAAGLL